MLTKTNTQRKKQANKSLKKQIKKYKKLISRKQYKKQRRTIKKYVGGASNIVPILNAIKKYIPLGSTPTSHIVDVKYKLLRLTRDANECDEKGEIDQQKQKKLKDFEDISCDDIKNKKSEVKNIMDGTVDGQYVRNILRQAKGKFARLRSRHAILNTPVMISMNFYICMAWWCRRKNIPEENRRKADIGHTDLLLKNFVNNPEKLQEYHMEMEKIKKSIHEEKYFQEASKASTEINKISEDQHRSELDYIEEQTPTNNNEVNKITDQVYNIYKEYVGEICGSEWIQESNEINYLTKYEVNELVKFWPKDIVGQNNIDIKSYFENSKDVPIALFKKFMPTIFKNTSGGKKSTNGGDGTLIAIEFAASWIYCFVSNTWHFIFEAECDPPYKVILLGPCLLINILHCLVDPDYKAS